MSKFTKLCVFVCDYWVAAKTGMQRWPHISKSSPNITNNLCIFEFLIKFSTTYFSSKTIIGANFISEHKEKWVNLLNYAFSYAILELRLKQACKDGLISQKVIQISPITFTFFNSWVNSLQHTLVSKQSLEAILFQSIRRNE